jgi:DNA repair exonuclease SbcCD ATPase subunit
MHQQILKMQKKINDLKSTKQTLTRLKTEAVKRLDAFEQKYKDGLKGRKIIQTKATEFQKDLELYLSETVSMALRAVIKNPPEFKLKFESKRNKTECNPVFIEHGKEQHPLDSAGHGCVNITTFALRIGIWSLDKNEPCLIFDEPFKDLSPNYHRKASEMIVRLCESEKIQIILVSHSPTINSKANINYWVERHGKVSEVSIV